MWRRNLLFIGVCLVAAAALAASLSPVHAPPARQRSRRAPLPDMQPVVAQIDASFHRQWSSSGIAPANRAAELTIARRLWLALAGTIPSLEEIRQFEARAVDEPDNGIDLWLSDLLADRRTADYLAERLARAYVGTEDGPFLIYRRRRFVSWLADELHTNRPYDQIVRRMLSAEGLWTSQPATNFITVTVQPDNQKGPDAARLAARTSRAFLGLRLDCAECHDHPFAPWKQADFQSLAGFFGQADNSLRGIHDVDRQPEIDDPSTGQRKSVTPGVPFAAEVLPPDGPLRERLAGWITSPQNQAFPRATVNRLWAILFGRPLVEPIDDLPTDAALPEPLVILANDFARHGYDLARLIRVIVSTEVFQLESRATEPAAPTSAAESQPTKTSAGDSTISIASEEARSEVWAAFPLTRLRPEQVVGSLLQASSLATLNYESHILVRFARAVGTSEFIKHYGDSGADEFAPQAGTIPQRLLLMNGKLIGEKTKDSLIGNAATQIAVLASTDEKAVEIAYLACLSRRPTPEEREHFVARLAGSRGDARREALGDIYWALVNSTEFSWNH